MYRLQTYFYRDIGLLHTRQSWLGETFQADVNELRATQGLTHVFVPH